MIEYDIAIRHTINPLPIGLNPRTIESYKDEQWLEDISKNRS